VIEALRYTLCGKLYQKAAASAALHAARQEA
jgi:hypothetical protein